MSIPKDNPSQSRFWDHFNTEDLKTTDNFKARFGPTEGGGSNSWANKRVKVSAQITDKEDKPFISDIAVFYISKIVTKSDDPTAELHLHSLHKPLQKTNAEKVKEAGQWWENAPISFLINKLLELVYKGPDGMLPEKYMVSRRDLSSELGDQDLRYWNLGVPPNWDGQTFNPSPNANPITAMVDIPESDNIVIGLGGFDGHKAELWRYNTTEDTWSLVGSNGSFEGPIQELVYNPGDSLIYGVCWEDQASNQSNIEASNHKWIAPDAKLFWRDPFLDEGEIPLDHEDRSTDIPDFFPGQWDIREMFPMDSNTSLPENSSTLGELGPFDKDDFKASVGNFEGVEHIRAPLPNINSKDSSKFLLVDDKDYRYEQNPHAGEAFPFTNLPITDKGVTSWLDPASENFSISLFIIQDSVLEPTANHQLTNGVVSCNMGALIRINSKWLNPRFNYRIRVKGLDSSTSNDLEVLVLGQYWESGSITDTFTLIPAEAIDGQDKEWFIQCPIVEGKEDNFLLAIQVSNGTGDPQNIQIEDVSITACTHWKIRDIIRYQAGENIPITHYSKVVAGVYNPKATNTGQEGPKYDMFDERTGDPFLSKDINVETLFFLSGADSDIGFIGDNNGVIYRTQDGGDTWSKRGLTTPPRRLFSMHFFNSNNGIIVGQTRNNDTAIFRSINASSPNAVWDQISVDGLDRDIFKIRFIDGDNGWLVGARGSIFQTTNGGISWIRRRDPVSESARDIHIFSATSVIVCRDWSGSNLRVWKTTDSGGNWTNINIPTSPRIGETLVGMSFIDNDTGYLGGNLRVVNTNVNLVGVWKTTNGGDSWAQLFDPFSNTDFPTNYKMTDLRFSSATLGFFCTSQGTIYKFNSVTDEFDKVHEDNQNRAFREIFIRDNDNIMVVGDNALIAVSTDGGDTWEESSGDKWAAEEISLDLNLIAQNRKKLSKDQFVAFNPLYGPSKGEAGISVDNSIRTLIAHSLNFEIPTNNVVIKDVAPAFDYINRFSQTWVGKQALLADPVDFRSGEAGNGYLSVVARAIGNRAGNPSNDSKPLKGIVRYTNGQQGFFQLVPEADEGNGVILFCQLMGDKPNFEERYKWGPGSNRFRTKLTAFYCGSKTFMDVMPLETPFSPNPGDLYNESFQTLYPIAGTSNGTKVYISLVANPVYTKSFTGDNQDEVSSPNFIYEIDLGKQSSILKYMEYKENVEADGGEIIDEEATMHFFDGLYGEDSALIRYGVYKKTVEDDGGEIIDQDATFKYFQGLYGEGPLKVIYDSRKDQSLYNTRENEEGELEFPGNVTNEYVQLDQIDNAGPQNRTRKITHLFYSKHFDKLFGSCFRKDSLLTVPNDIGLTPPCHEVFYHNPNSPNQLVIIDHDIQLGDDADAIKFTGFSDQEDRLWYFRLSNPTIEPHKYQRLNKGAKVNYYTEERGFPEGGLFWDGDLKNIANSKPLKEDRKFLSHNKAITSLISPNTNIERHTLFSSFDYYFRRSDLTQETLDEIVGRPYVFFKLDSFGLDKRVELADFEGLKIWDAISKLAGAHNLVFGFNRDKFFIVPRNRSIKTTSLEKLKGDIISINKEASDDIRNIVSASAYSPQLENAEWEVSHVESDNRNQPNNLDDERLFEGEFSISVKNNENSSILMICTKRGRLLTLGFEQEAIDIGDANVDIWDRNPPLFKWLTHLPSVNIVLMQDLSIDGKELLVNTTYQGSPRSIQPGDIVVFTHQESLEPVGKIIEEIDFVQNRLILEEPLGFSIDKFSNLEIIRSHVGSDTSGPPNFNSTVSDWGSKFSDDGLAVIKSVRLGIIQGDKPSNKVVRAQALPYFGVNNWLLTFIFEKNHGLNIGDSFNIVKTGDPNFEWSGSYTVSQKGNKDVRVVVSLPSAPSSLVNSNKSIEIYLQNDVFEAPGLGTILSLNSLNAFRGVNFKPYGAGYKHFNFLITTLQSEALARVDLPNANKEANEIVNLPLAYIHDINFNTMEVDLGPGDYSQVFEKGDIINAHYIMSPTSDREGVPPYMGLSQTLPGGVASWRWIAEPTTDLFNIGDVIRLRFPGKKLVKDSSSTYTLYDSKSIKKWGEHEYTIPDNRFIEHREVIDLVREVIQEFGEPGLDLTIVLPYRPDIGFLTLDNQSLQEVEIIDPAMFGSIPGFKVSGTIKSQELDLGRKIIEINITSKQKY